MGEAARTSIDERARLYVERMDTTVCGTGSCHRVTFHVACVLVQGFGLSRAAAAPILADWAGRGTHRWTEAELAHKLNCAERAPGLQTKDGLRPTGCLRDEGGIDSGVGKPIRNDAPSAAAVEEKPTKVDRPEFSPPKLREMAGKWRDIVDLAWLANRSAKDPAQVSSSLFLQTLYPMSEKVLLFTTWKSQGQAVWPADKVPTEGPEGVWYLAQPVDGLYHPNPRNLAKDGQPKMSRRSEESVTAFRYMVLESDTADMRDWLGLLVQLPLRIEAIYTSGGRSIHVLVRVDCPTRRAWDDERKALEPTLNLLNLGGNDAGALSCVRLTRLPGAMRLGKRDKQDNYRRLPVPALQKLLYLRPNAPLRALKDIPATRDVESFWCEMASVGIGDADEGSGVSWLLGGLGYYANVSERVRAALERTRENLGVTA
jgi:hypothetical protein